MIKIYKCVRIYNDGYHCFVGHIGRRGAVFYGFEDAASALDVGMFFATGDWIVERVQ